MSAVDAAAGENAMRDLIGTAFAAGEPGLPEVDEVMTVVEVLGGRIRHRQRVRTGIAAGVLCVAGFGMVAGIAAVAHSTRSTSDMVVPGGSGGPAAPDSAQDSAPAGGNTVGGRAISPGP
ncbi:MAG: hypothetical protein AUG49_06670 [Catenulispora sp. 13_1_20CM_3_70_7]|jgi:hypothetical protein|nr:hypothetical protein [Catenulisporales bacterium]OLE26980.1 MAG: hypothetical protein AUG49_06670 [Catenulispora sp. 13_1_20CM_3_70_7]